MDFARFLHTLQTQCHLSQEKTMLLGVSGGADSLCLLHACHRLGFNIVVAHMDHAIRSESPEDARFVAEMAGTLAVPFVSERFDVVGYAAQEKMSLEEAARVLRYRFLFDQARRQGAQAVAVAHTADDQVETVLMHFLRGSGLSGLRGMEYSSLLPEMEPDIPLVRPLLGVWREEIDDYCRQAGLEPRQDITNQDTRYYRNRLRHELIPYLKEYNPGIKSVIWNMSRSAAGDHDIIRQSTAAAWKDVRQSEGEGYVELSLCAMQTLQTGVCRNVVRFAIEHLRPQLRDIGFDAVDRVVKFIHAPSRSAEMDITDRLKVIIEGESLLIADWDAEVPMEDFLALAEQHYLYLAENESVALNSQWTMQCIVVHEEPGWAGWKSGTGADTAWLDGQYVTFPLLIRTWQEGDRFWPLGMAGKSVKLSDFWVNNRVPRRVRRRYPLVCSQDDIVWVPGYRLAHPYRITENTRHYVCIRLEKTP